MGIYVVLLVLAIIIMIGMPHLTTFGLFNQSWTLKYNEAKDGIEQ